MEYSKIEDAKNILVNLHYEIKEFIRNNTDKLPEIKAIDKCTKDICFIIGDLDYMIPDGLLQKIHTVYLNTDAEVGLFDSKGNSIDEAEEILYKNYNPKMMSKILNFANEIYIRIGVNLTPLSLQQAMKLLHL